MYEKYLDQLEVAHNTRLAYRQGLRKFRAYRKGRDLSPELMAGFVRYLQDEELSLATQLLYLTVTAHYLAWLIEQGEVEVPESSLRIELSGEYSHAEGDTAQISLYHGSLGQPLQSRMLKISVTRPHPHLPPADDIQKLTRWADNPGPTKTLTEKLTQFRDRAFFKILMATGLRPSEIVSLRSGNIDWDTGQVTLTIKGSKPAVVILPPGTLDSIKRYLTIRRELDLLQNKPWSELPILSRHDKKAGLRVLPISVRTSENIMKRIYRAGVTMKITPRLMRHYAASNILEKSGGNAFLVQHALSHSQLVTTRGYVDYPKEQAERDLRNLGDALLEPLAATSE